MSETKNWALTQLGRGTSLQLVLGDSPDDPKAVVYTVAQFTCTHAVNEVPNAQCLLAVGREVRTLAAAEVHRTADQLRQMRRCFVVFYPVGEYKPDGTLWPQRVLVFDGYFMGLASSKIGGKVQVIANLKHWAYDLCCSSCLTHASHPANPTELTSRAICHHYGEAGAAGTPGQPIYVSELCGHDVVLKHVVDDFWAGLKELLCGMADVDACVGGSAQEGNCGAPLDGSGLNAYKNDRAKKALARFEGPGLACARKYVYGVPLPLDLLHVAEAERAVAQSVSMATIESFAHTTFWDKLVADYCQPFGLAVVPAVDYGLIVADLPAYRGLPNAAGGTDVWRTLGIDEYDSFQEQAELERPLRAVGTFVDTVAGFGVPEAGNTPQPGLPSIQGCFTAESVDPSDGTILYVKAPAWLCCLMTCEPYAGSTTGEEDESSPRSDTTPDAAGSDQRPRSSAAIKNDARQLFNNYARKVFVDNMLRGRSGVVGGKLRFDVAPGSVVLIKGSEERFLAGEDVLATDMYGCVTRVTTLINAEGRQAGTSFMLTHLRTAAENKEDRTSVEEHPLFRHSIHGGGLHGAPLVSGHEKL